jgi:hypothetical protein
LTWSRETRQKTKINAKIINVARAERPPVTATTAVQTAHDSLTWGSSGSVVSLSKSTYPMGVTAWASKKLTYMNAEGDRCTATDCAGCVATLFVGTNQTVSKERNLAA